MTLLRAQSHGHSPPSFRRCRTSATGVCLSPLDRPPPRPQLLSLDNTHRSRNRQSVARSIAAPGRPFRRRSRCPTTRRSCTSRCEAHRPHIRPRPHPCKPPFSHVVRHSQGAPPPLTLTALLCRPGPQQSLSTLATGVLSRLRRRTSIGRRRIVIIVYPPRHLDRCCLRAMTRGGSARSASAQRSLRSTNRLSRNCARQTVGAHIFVMPHIDKNSFSDLMYVQRIYIHPPKILPFPSGPRTRPKFRSLTVRSPLGRIYDRLLLRLSSVHPNTVAESPWGHFV
jgi:hypothetical protein